MGLFFDSSGSSLYLPCFTLVDAPKLVPLPGVSYKVSFERDSIIHVLSEFKRNVSFKNNPLLAKINATIAQNEIVVDSSVVKSCKLFHKQYSQEKGDGDIDGGEDAQMYIVLLPFEAHNHSIGAASRITAIHVEGETISITFKSIARVESRQPLLNLQQRLWKSSILKIDDLAELQTWDQKSINSSILSFVELFYNTNKIIKDFKAKYLSALKPSSDADTRIFSLSPLANILFLQLSTPHFNKSWKLLKVYLEQVTVLERNHDTCFELASMMDLVMSILPMSLTQRLEFLTAKKLKSRAMLFSTCIHDFQQIFKKLDDSVDYVNQHFSDSSNTEKSKLVAGQLRALRFYIDDIKRTNTSVTLKSNPRNEPVGVPSSDKFSKTGPDHDGDLDSNEEVEQIKSFIESLEEKNVHPDGIKLLQKDFKRFMKMTPQNADYQVLRNYFDIVMDIPFGKTANITSIDLEQSRAKLNEDHYGLQSVKRRLLEYLSVLKISELSANDTHLNSDLHTKGQDDVFKKSPILLLVGPPGVGKTSIAKSVADVLGRKFQRVSLGGIHNEAEIRGHRRTYVGSMCGLIISAIRKAGTMNPLILFDEVDKVLSGGVGGFGNRVNGDPGAALLEVLDPEQNSTFSDHYVGFPVDLSQVLFFCTANELEGISEPLLNRMELIELPGYTPDEKIKIGSKFLLSKQIKANGLNLIKDLPEIYLTDEAWNCVVLEYTREPGVRGLERRIGSIVRGKVVEYVEHKQIQGEVGKEHLYKYLGLSRHPNSEEMLAPTEHSEKFGVVNGLSYNSDGTGSVLLFEVIKVHTDENGSTNGPFIKTTGNLGAILEESIKIATSFVKHILFRGLIPGLNENDINEFLTSEYHLHVPMGAVSKDGPSAGAAISLAILSCALKRPVSPKLCMTGEITLRGKILAIGGVKEKLLGAQLYHMTDVLIPSANLSDVVRAVSEDNQEQHKMYMDRTTQPELQRLKDKTQLQLHYCSDFFDVLEATWPELLKKNIHRPRPSL
ncbi:unnamed protein product [Kluyveromyces dobzhanskii CBS 2104]|uniref:Lon protease homolog 2, peroxisomal n=1 Tax=Kluyveromyces dobzhanskii CBS 2104 TaxID=1427455 RepID=A0A0A8L1H9_9SACH|nr:unnamed protein product [Kluyveromyces dobzhanskii CBS 2104]